MDALLVDLRHALRSLRHTRAFTFGAVATLALGLGACTAMFSLVHALLLRPLPFREPERLAWVWSARVDRDKAFFSIPNFLDTRARSRSFTELAAFANWGANLTGSGEPERLQGVRILPETFAMLGARPAVGRLLVSADGAAGATPGLVLTHGLWTRRFGGDPGIVGRTLTLNGAPYVVTGVLPRDFLFPGTTDVQLAVPLALDTDPRHTERGSNFLRVYGRLAPGATPASAAAELATITDRLRRDFPNENGKLTAPRVLPLLDEVVGGYRNALWLLLAAVALVLLIACSNLAHLVLVRATARHREIALRLALGASRRRVVRQLLLESLLVAIAGGVAGLLLAAWSSALLLRLAPLDLPRATEVGLHLGVAGFALAACLACAVVFGLVPAWRGSRVDIQPSLAGTGRLTGASGHHRTRGALVVAQVALSVVLLVAAGLFFRSLARIQTVDPGFDPAGVVAVRLSLPAARYDTPDAVRGFYERLLPRLAALPGVRGTAAVSVLPLSGMNTRADFTVAGAPPPSADQVPAAQNRWITPGYMRTMGIVVLAGREFVASDGPGARPVAIVDRELARRFFSGRDAVGRHLLVSDAGDDPPRDVEIVGVAEDVHHFGLTDEATPTFYAPIAQVPKPSVGFLANAASVVVRVAGDPEAIGRRLAVETRTIDADVPASAPRTMDAVVAAAAAGKRFSTRLLEIFAVAALLLAATGLYAVISFGVALRRHEIGVRMALGATPGGVRRWVLRQGLALAATGVLLGLPAAWVVARWARSQLFGIAPGDPATFAIAALAMGLVALAATDLPARRATRVDPGEALRAE